MAGDEVQRERGVSACPIKEAASAAPVITPNAPLDKDSTRLACKSSMHIRVKN